MGAFLFQLNCEDFVKMIDENIKKIDDIKYNYIEEEIAEKPVDVSVNIENDIEDLAKDIFDTFEVE